MHLIHDWIAWYIVDMLNIEDFHFLTSAFDKKCVLFTTA